MNQQRAIGTVSGQHQVVPIARCLMPWYAFLREEIAISSTLPFSTVFLSSTLPFSTVFDRILPFSTVSVLCPSVMVRVSAWPEPVLKSQPDRKLVILAIACESMKSESMHRQGEDFGAFFSVWRPLFRALFSFPFWFERWPKRYMDCMKIAQASSVAQHRQESDEKRVGFLSCARRSSRAHLSEMTRLARHRRYLIPDLAGASTTNVNLAITSVVVLSRRLRYTFLREFRLLEEKYQWQKFRHTLCRRRSIGTTRPGYISVPIGASKELRYSVLDFPEGELYSFQKQKTRQVVW